MAKLEELEEELRQAKKAMEDAWDRGLDCAVLEKDYLCKLHDVWEEHDGWNHDGWNEKGTFYWALSMIDNGKEVRRAIVDDREGETSFYRYFNRDSRLTDLDIGDIEATNWEEYIE